MFAAGFICITVEDTYAQTRGRRRGGTPASRTSRTRRTTPAQNVNANTAVDPNAGMPKADTIPIVIVKSSNTDNPLSDSLAAFLRPNTAVDDNGTKVRERPPLDYEHLREDDAVFRQRIWRVIDTREKMNLPFSYGANVREDNGYQLLFAILYRGVVDGKYTAFVDENFSQPLTLDDFKKKASGGVDTLPVPSIDNPDVIIRKDVRVSEFPIELITEYKIKEEVIFDKESSRLFTRIIGIAPMGPALVSGKVVAGLEGRNYPMFWIYYPETRAYLSQFHAYNPKNMASRMTWEDVFENRYFSSYIVKSSFDNPRDIPLAEMSQLKDNPLFRLYEGETIKEKIFNYEQNLWSY